MDTLYKENICHMVSGAGVDSVWGLAPRVFKSGCLLPPSWDTARPAVDKAVVIVATCIEDQAIIERILAHLR
ncbi:MAG: hypothetical protein CMP00_06285 [Woeseiaceae bacterium]|nr:hypothetical protein [Woeseiaceae bacterium]